MNNIQSLLDIARNATNEDEREKAAKELNRLDRIEREKRAQDEIMVHNILEDDFVVYWDRGGANLKYRIPGRAIDTGDGKGNKVLPRFVAEKAMNEIIIKHITEIAHIEAERIKKEYRGEWVAGQIERQVTRTNNKKQWEDCAKEIWLGVVRVYGSEVVDDVEQEVIVETNKVQEDVVKKLGLDTLVYQEKKKQLVEEVEHGTKN